jgi:hypothetical protein
MERDVARLTYGVAETNTRLQRLEKSMADVSPILNKLVDDMAAWAAGPFAALLQENADLRAYKASKENEDVNEPAAAQRAVDGFNAFAAPVSESPEVPADIPPVEVPEPQPEVPAEDAGDAEPQQ